MEHGDLFLISCGTGVAILLTLWILSKKEIQLGLYTLLWGRISLVCLFVLYAFQLWFDRMTLMRNERHYPVYASSVPIVRPLLGTLICFLSWFFNTHFTFRLVVLLTQPILIVWPTIVSAWLIRERACRIDGTCTKLNPIHTVEQLEWLIIIQYLCIAFTIWVLIAGATLSAIIGIFTTRHPIRFFSWTNISARSSYRRSEAQAHDSLNRAHFWRRLCPSFAKKKAM